MADPVLRAPFPYFGGKRRAADLVWKALGRVDHYIEPFCGSAAVILARPGGAGRCETVNDKDGMIANFWRSVKSHPKEVAQWADWPINEIDQNARHKWLIAQRENLTEQLIADPDWCDPKVAGWWVWGSCLWIGSGWCSRESRQLPAIGSEGMGVHSPRRNKGVGENHGFTGTVEEWLVALSNRLRRVRVTCGDWQRVVSSPSVLYPGAVGKPNMDVGIFLDPPYAEGEMDYAVGGTGTDLSAQVRAWALEAGKEPRLRIVLAGYQGEHEMPGWTVVEWTALGGYASQGTERTENRKRERLWLSPRCVGGENSKTNALELFDNEDDDEGAADE